MRCLPAGLSCLSVLVITQTVFQVDPEVPRGLRLPQVQGGLLAGGGRDRDPRPRRAHQHQAQGPPGARRPKERRRSYEDR